MKEEKAAPEGRLFVIGLNMERRTAGTARMGYFLVRDACRVRMARNIENASGIPAILLL